MNEVCGICGEEKPSSEVCVDCAYEYDISRDRKEGKLELQISNQAEIIEDLQKELDYFKDHPMAHLLIMPPKFFEDQENG